MVCLVRASGTAGIIGAIILCTPSYTRQWIRQGLFLNYLFESAALPSVLAALQLWLPDAEATAVV